MVAQQGHQNMLHADMVVFGNLRFPKSVFNDQLGNGPDGQPQNSVRNV